MWLFCTVGFNEIGMQTFQPNRNNVQDDTRNCFKKLKQSESGVKVQIF